MDGRFNTITGWLLFGGICALGFSILSGKYFHADNPERPEQMGFFIEGVESAEGGEEEMPIGMLMAKAEMSNGETVFKKCVACHTIEQGGADGIGPNLYGIMGAPVAGGGFAYSDGLKAVGGTWNWDNMNAWLISPRKFAPGTKMTFAGLGKPEDRADVMAYMNSYGSNLPLPETPAVDPAAAEGEAGEAPAEGEEEATPETTAPTGDAAAAALGVPSSGAAVTQPRVD